MLIHVKVAQLNLFQEITHLKGIYFYGSFFSVLYNLRVIQDVFALFFFKRKDFPQSSASTFKMEEFHLKLRSETHQLRKNQDTKNTTIKTREGQKINT